MRSARSRVPQTFCLSPNSEQVRIRPSPTFRFVHHVVFDHREWFWNGSPDATMTFSDHLDLSVFLHGANTAIPQIKRSLPYSAGRPAMMNRASRCSLFHGSLTAKDQVGRKGVADNPHPSKAVKTNLAAALLRTGGGPPRHPDELPVRWSVGFTRTAVALPPSF